MERTDLAKFCGNNYPEVFSIDGHTYATNGHVVVRVPRIRGIDDPPPRENMKESCPKLFSSPQPDGDGAEIPELPDPIWEDCKICRGGRVCPECHGKGVVLFDNEFHNYKVDCGSCQGAGKYDPETCSCENGKRLVDQYFMIGSVCFNAHYLHALKSLPGCRIYIVDKERYKMSAQRFTFDGGEGLIMPCHPSVMKKHPEY